MNEQKLIVVIKDARLKRIFAFDKDHFDRAEQTFINQCELLYDGVLPDDIKDKALYENSYILCNSSVMLVTAPLLGSVTLINSLKNTAS